MVRRGDLSLPALKCWALLQSVKNEGLTSVFFPAKTIFTEFQQKLSFVASMRQMPSMSWNKMTICPCHITYILFFMAKNEVIAPKYAYF